MPKVVPYPEVEELTLPRPSPLSGVSGAEYFQGSDCDWFACDSVGQVAHFTSAGGGFVPVASFTLGDHFDHASELLSKLPETRSGAVSDEPWNDEMAARRGFFAYDSEYGPVYDDEGRPYSRERVPESPVHVDSFPPEVRDVIQVMTIDGVRFDERTQLAGKLLREAEGSKESRAAKLRVLSRPTPKATREKLEHATFQWPAIDAAGQVALLSGSGLHAPQALIEDGRRSDEVLEAIRGLPQVPVDDDASRCSPAGELVTSRGLFGFRTRYGAPGDFQAAGVPVSPIQLDALPDEIRQFAMNQTFSQLRFDEVARITLDDVAKTESRS